MMKRIRYLTLLMLLQSSIGLWAQDDPFNPTSPGEPGPPGVITTMLSLVADPTDGGTVSGAGWYETGASVTVRAAAAANYVFSHWTNESGETLSTVSQFKYTKKEGDETLTAHFRFSPGNPAEPVEIAQFTYHQLKVVVGEGGTVSGGGKYLPDTRVYVTCSANTGYVFNGWYNSAGEKVASTMGYYYTTTTKDETLTARFTFNPSSPGEPYTPVFTPTYKVTVTTTEGGTVNTSGATLAEGGKLSMSASVNTGYKFVGWYVGDVCYSTSSSITYTMGTADIAFEARFVFNPSAPAEPSMSTTTRHAFFLMNKVTTPGTTVQFPIYLSNVRTVKDMVFQLTFPPELLPDMEKVTVSERASGYELSYEVQNDTTYTISLLGGEVPAGNAAVIVFDIPVANDIRTMQGYPIKINQVEVTEADGTVTTGSTRNGRISVYKEGDTNTDDAVDIGDIVTVISVMTGTETDPAIVAIADVNGDGAVDIGDIITIIDIMTGQASAARGTALARGKSNETATDYLESTLSGDELKLSLTNSMAYTAFQLTLTLPEGSSLHNVAMNLKRGSSHTVAVRPLGEGRYLILGYSLTGRPLTNDSGELLTVSIAGQKPGTVTINDVVLATTNGRTFHLTDVETMQTGTTAITDVSQKKEDVNGTLYDLQGRRVGNFQPKKGIYIIGNKKSVIK